MDTFKNLISKIAQSLWIWNEQPTTQASPVQPQAFDINNVDFSNIQPIAQEQPSLIAQPQQVDFSNIQPIAPVVENTPLFDTIQQPQLLLQDTPIQQQPFDISQLDLSQPITPVVDMPITRDFWAEIGAAYDNWWIPDYPAILNIATDAAIAWADSVANWIIDNVWKPLLDITKSLASAASTPENLNRWYNIAFWIFDDVTSNIGEKWYVPFWYLQDIDKPNAFVSEIFPQIKVGAKAKQQLEDKFKYDVSNINVDSVAFSLDNNTPTTWENVAAKVNNAFWVKISSPDDAIKFINIVDKYRKAEIELNTPLYIPPTWVVKNTIQYTDTEQNLERVIKKRFWDVSLSANQRAYYLQAMDNFKAEAQTIQSFQDPTRETKETRYYRQILFDWLARNTLLNAEIQWKIKSGVDAKQAKVEVYKNFLWKDYVEWSEDFVQINEDNLTNTVFKKLFNGIPISDSDRTIKQIASKIKLIELWNDKNISVWDGIDKYATLIGVNIDKPLTALAWTLWYWVRSLWWLLQWKRAADYNLNDRLWTTDSWYGTTKADVAGNYVSEYWAWVAKFVGTSVLWNALWWLAWAWASKIPWVLRIGWFTSNASRLWNILTPLATELAENIPFYFTYWSTFWNNVSKENVQQDIFLSAIVWWLWIASKSMKAAKYHSTVFNNISDIIKTEQSPEIVRWITDYLQSKWIKHDDVWVLTQYALDTMDVLTKTPKWQNEIIKLRANQTFADRAKQILWVNTIEDVKTQYWNIDELKRQYTAIEWQEWLDIEKFILANKINKYYQVQALANTFWTKLQDIFLIDWMDNKMAEFAVLASSPRLAWPNSIVVNKVPTQEATLFDVDSSWKVKEEQYVTAKAKATEQWIDIDTILKKNNDGTYSVPLSSDKSTITKMALVDSSIAKTMLVYNIIENWCL